MLLTEFWKKELLNEFGSAEEFKALWDRYKNLKHNFYIIDLVNEPQKLFAEISLRLSYL